MNGLEIILILLVPLGVWVFSTIFKSDDERGASRLPPGSNPGAQRRKVTDMERFLEEARRRREAAEGRQQQPAPQPQRAAPPQPIRPVRVPERRAARVPEPPRRPPVASPQTRPARVAVLAERVTEVVPVPGPATKAEPVRSVQEPLPEVLPVATPSPLVPAPLQRLPTSGPRPTLSPALVQLADMLRTPRSAATAMVLREIFDRPLSRRGR